MEIADVKFGQRAVFQHIGNIEHPHNGKTAFIIGIGESDDNTVDIIVDDGGEENAAMWAYASELTLVSDVRNEPARDLGALYREMQKDLEQLHYNHDGDLDAMAAFMVYLGWEKRGL